jgi:Fe-S cluster assembly protein SufD
VDNTTVLDHAKPHCPSDELYKGIYFDRARGVFSGTIIVRQDAQKTNAIQSNNTLLMSKDARVETRPQLKIWADDVKCTHGATVGQLDDEGLFYMRSRGIGLQEAQRILTLAFAHEVTERIEDEGLQACVTELLDAQLNEALGS